MTEFKSSKDVGDTRPDMANRTGASVVSDRSIGGRIRTACTDAHNNVLTAFSLTLRRPSLMLQSRQLRRQIVVCVLSDLGCLVLSVAIMSPNFITYSITNHTCCTVRAYGGAWKQDKAPEFLACPLDGDKIRPISHSLDESTR